MQLFSLDFDPSGTMPELFTCFGADISPSMQWSDVPFGAGSLVLTCQDPDAARGTFWHWAVFDIPMATPGLPRRLHGPGLSTGIRQGLNDFGRLGYSGPCPPRNSGNHRYIFRLYALKATVLGLPEGTRCQIVDAAARLQAMEGAELLVHRSR